MGNQQKRENLFKQHVNDLRALCPLADEVFVCPICFGVFTSQDLDDDQLDVGHVWPSYVRSITDRTNQQILLCKNCNSSAGHKGDINMQKIAEYLEGERRGKATSLSKLTISEIENLDEKFEVAGFVDVDPNTKNAGNFRFSYPKAAFEHNVDLQKLQEIGNVGNTWQVVREPYGVDWDIGLVGWLTSGYLYTFYHFGYRYVLTDQLDAAREIIRASFMGNFDNRLSYAHHKDTTVYHLAEDYTLEPTLNYCVPVENRSASAYMMVHLLSYHIILPAKNPENRRFLSQGNVPKEVLGIGRPLTREIVRKNPEKWDQVWGELSYTVRGQKLYG